MAVERFSYVVYAGSEKLDLGPKEPTAICSSESQANALIKALWPGFGYWERAYLDDVVTIVEHYGMVKT